MKHITWSLVLEFRNPVESEYQAAEEDVRELWVDREMGNDSCYVAYCKPLDQDEYQEKYPNLYQFLENQDISSCLIRYWW